MMKIQPILWNAPKVPQSRAPGASWHAWAHPGGRDGWRWI